MVINHLLNGMILQVGRVSFGVGNIMTLVQDEGSWQMSREKC